MRRLTAIDLFSGCGGLTLGLKQAGFKVLAAVELDPVAASTYEKNHPEVLLCEDDIRRVPASALLRAFCLRPGELDLLAGCPPCQGFSTMKTLNGSAPTVDPGNELIFEYLRFVRVLRPKALMLENVPALIRDRRFHRFRAELQRLGYVVNAEVLDAAFFGVPQRRRRLIMLAAKSAKVEFAAPSANFKTVRRAFQRLSARRARTDALHNLPEMRSAQVRELIRHIPKNGGSREDAPNRFLLECHKRCDGFHDVYGRMAWDKVAPTITSGCFNPSKGRFIHPSKDRAITMREAALLQSFPVTYTFSLDAGKTGAALMIGNALPPEFIKRHARQLARHLKACEQT